jgi:uncharacterized protein
MLFTWDENKNRQNLRKHGVRFETAILAFEDPFTLTQRDDSSEEEERWITVGAVGAHAVLLVVHTHGFENEEETIRVISARAAGSHERKAYEEAHKSSKTGNQVHRRKKGRAH